MKQDESSMFCLNPLLTNILKQSIDDTAIVIFDY